MIEGWIFVGCFLVVAVAFLGVGYAIVDLAERVRTLRLKGTATGAVLSPAPVPALDLERGSNVTVWYHRGDDLIAISGTVGHVCPDLVEIVDHASWTKYLLAPAGILEVDRVG